MLNAIRRALPGPARHAIKSVLIDPLRDHRRRSRLKQVIRRFKAGERDIELIKEARNAWGNEGFSADLRYVTEAVELAETSKHPILECGTGLTTLVCGAIAQRRGIAMYCLEQDLEWLHEVRRVLFGLEVQIFHAPLVRSEDYAWYDTRGIPLPKRLGAVICDGPFVSTDWPTEIHANWRYGVLPVLSAAGITYDRLLLDDANESRAPRILQRWAQDFSASYRLIHSEDGDCAMVSS